MSRVSSKERKRIVAYLKDGKTQGWVARETGRGKATISRIANAAGIDAERSATKKANEARRDYAQAERLLLLNEGFDKARDILPSIREPRELQAWMVAVATGIDKRRLEDGEATERGDYTHREAGEKDLEAYFGELDAFGAQGGEAGTRQPVDPSPPNGQAT